MAIIGFLKYQDFLNELEIRLPDLQAAGGHVVRVESVRQSFPTEPPLKLIQSSVIAQTELGADILIASFLIGSVLSLHIDKVRLASKMVEKARDLIINDLAERGYEIRPGLIAGWHTNKAECDPGDLWTEQSLMALVQLSENGS